MDLHKKEKTIKVEATDRLTLMTYKNGKLLATA